MLLSWPYDCRWSRKRRKLGTDLLGHLRSAPSSRYGLSLALLLGACTAPSTPASDSPHRRSIVDRSDRNATLAVVPVLELPAALDLIYRVRPDRRFVDAAAEIVEIAAGREVGQVEIELVEGAWKLSVEGRAALVLPELATFADALSALSGWAAEHVSGSIGPTPPAVLAQVDADIARFYPRFLFSALRRLDAGGPLDAAASARAARAAGLLTVQMHDAFDLGDPLRGRALALLALARSRDSGCCAETEALLASAFGYEAEARSLASALPAGFARAFVSDEELPAAGGAAERWLVLRRALEAGAQHGRPLAHPARLDVEAGSLLLAAPSRDGDGVKKAQSLMLRSLREGAADAVPIDGDDVPLDDLPLQTASAGLRQFEERLPSFTSAQGSRWLDADSITSFYEASWYSALGAELDALERFGSQPSTSQFVSSLQPRTATARNVVAWMSNLVAARYGRYEASQMAAAFTSVGLLGGSSRWELFEAIASSVGNPPELRHAARRLFPTLDSRPAETRVAGELADFPIGHLARRDLYLRSALARAPRQEEGQLARLLTMAGDRERLREVAEDRNAPFTDRLHALDYLGKVTDLDLAGTFDRLFSDSGYPTDGIPVYADYLNRRGQPGLKEALIRKVLNAHPEIDPITEAYLASSLADALERQGRYEEAWTWVQPRVGVFSATILSSAVSLLQRLDRDGEAVDLGRRMVERYPSAGTRADFAEVLWRMGRSELAAELFDPARHEYSTAEARQALPEAFALAFGDEDLAAALTAYEALIAAGVPVDVLGSFAGVARVHGHDALALALVERYLEVPTSGVDRGRQVLAGATGYELVREKAGSGAADQWLAATFADGADLPLLISLLSNGRLELLEWIVRVRSPRAKPALAGSILAAALALQRVPLSDGAWGTVRSLMDASPAPDLPAIVTGVRHVLGEADAVELAATASTPETRAEALYYLGVRAVADGDYDRALGYFLAAAEGPANYPPASWAISQLYIWRAQQRSWQDLPAAVADPSRTR